MTTTHTSALTRPPTRPHRDIVYYNSQFWHRGWNPEGLPRWTLHCSWQDNSAPLWSGNASQKAPMALAGHIDRFPPLARLMAQRYQDAPESALTADDAAMSGSSQIPWRSDPVNRAALATALATASRHCSRHCSRNCSRNCPRHCPRHCSRHCSHLPNPRTPPQEPLVRLYQEWWASSHCLRPLLRRPFPAPRLELAWDPEELAMARL